MPKLSSKALTDTTIRNLKIGKTRIDHFDAVQRGLGLRVAPSGLKSWFVMRRINGKMRRISIGRYPEVTLSAARKKAADLLDNIATGNNPAMKAAPTFEVALKDWFDREQDRKRGASEKRRALNLDAIPALGELEMNAITRSEIRALIDRIVDRGAPVHANRMLAYLRRFFNWAVERDIISASPAAGLKAPTAETSRDRTLSEAELKAVWKASFVLSVPFDAYFRMLILTGQRRNEVAGACWKEFDLGKAEWIIPASRAKNGSAHLVHLSPEALDSLSGMPRFENSPFVFTTKLTSPISGFSKIKTTIDEKSGVTGWTIHDLRRTFATVGTGQLGIDPVVMDKILNHRSGVVKGVAAVYQRAAYLEPRKAALAKWGKFVAGPAA